MIIYTKRQMLEEGFWSALKAGTRASFGAARAGAGLAADALNVVAPEVTRPIKSVKDYTVGTTTKAWQNFEKIWKGKTKFIHDKLLQASFKMDMTKPPKKIRRGEYLVYAQKIVGYDPKGKPILAHYKDNSLKQPTPLIVDAKTGAISKNIDSFKSINKPKRK